MAKKKKKEVNKPRNPFAVSAKFRNSAGKMKDKKQKHKENPKLDIEDYVE